MTDSDDRDRTDDVNPPLPDGGPTDGTHGTDDDTDDDDGIDLEGRKG